MTDTFTYAMYNISYFITVCVGFLGKFYQLLQDENVKFDSTSIEKALVKSCKDARGKENRFVRIR